MDLDKIYKFALLSSFAVVFIPFMNLVRYFVVVTNLLTITGLISGITLTAFTMNNIWNSWFEGGVKTHGTIIHVIGFISSILSLIVQFRYGYIMPDFYNSLSIVLSVIILLIYLSNFVSKGGKNV